MPNPYMTYRYMTPNRPPMTPAPIRTSSVASRLKAGFTSEKFFKEATLSILPGGRVVRSLKSAPSIFSKLGNFGKNIYSRLYSPATLSGLGKVAGTTAVAGGVVGLTKYGVTGNPKDLLAGPKTFANLLGYRVSPVAGAVGTLSGIGSNVANFTKAKNPFKDDHTNYFKYPTQPDYSDIFKNMQYPEIPGAQIYMTPSSGFGASPSISVNAGGGGDFGLTQALLLGILGAGGLGYMLGRKKRKKKKRKYKRRKRR